MLGMKMRLCLLVAALAVIAGAMPYTPSSAVDYAETWWDDFNDEYNTYGYDCANFVSQCLRAGFGGSFTWLRRFADGNAVRQLLGCRWPKSIADEHG